MYVNNPLLYKSLLVFKIKFQKEFLNKLKSPKNKVSTVVTPANKDFLLEKFHHSSLSDHMTVFFSDIGHRAANNCKGDESASGKDNP